MGHQGDIMLLLPQPAADITADSAGSVNENFHKWFLVNSGVDASLLILSSG
jgi:hypothetical protein